MSGPSPAKDPGQLRSTGVEVSMLSLHSGPELVRDRGPPHSSAYPSHFPSLDTLAADSVPRGQRV